MIARNIWTIAICFLALQTWASQKPIPSSPKFYLLDEAKVLSYNAHLTLRNLLVEHDRATGQQFYVAIFDSLDTQDIQAYSHEVFSQWKIGHRGQDNGALLTLFWKEKKARIEVGFGLESVLTDQKTKEVLNDFLEPQLKKNHPDHALLLSSYKILEALDSPLVESGKALEALKSVGIKNQDFNPGGSSDFGIRSWSFLLLIGGIFLVLVLNWILSREAQFTSQGWFRPNIWKHLKYQFKREKPLPSGGSSGDF